MPVSLQYKKTGGSAARLTQTFLAGEAFFDTDVDGWFIGDSVTPGGLQVANAHITTISTNTQTVGNSDAGKFFVYTNSGGCGVALGAPGSGGGTYFPLDAGFWLLNLSPGNVVVTVTGATVNGSATLTLNPNDSAVIVSNGTNYFALVARTGISLSSPQNIAIIGNTTGATSSSSFAVSASTVSATGGLSIGYSGSTLVFSNPSVNATENISVLGNTTANTSSISQTIGASTISGAGDLSVGFQGSTLVLSAPAAATSTSGRNAVALGQTTGATSSSVLTLTNMSVSGAAGVSVGFSTTAAAAGVLVISQAPIGGTTTGRNWSAVGNPAGTTSSAVLNITNETYSFGGFMSGGFSAGTFVISGSLTGAQQALSYFEPRPLNPGVSFNIGNTGAHLSPILLPAQLTFNRVKYIYSYNYATLFGPNLAVASTTTSDTLTANCSFGGTFTVAYYTQVNSTQWSSVTSATASTAFSVAGSVSRSSSSLSASQTISYTFNADTGTVSTTASTSTSGAAAGLTLSMGTNTISTIFTGLYEFVFGLSTTMNTGLCALGLKSTNATSQTTLSTGASYSAMGVAPIGPFFYFCGAGGNVAIKTTPGPSLVLPHPFGAGSISSAGSALPTSYNLSSASFLSSFYGCPYIELYTHA